MQLGPLLLAFSAAAGLVRASVVPALVTLDRRNGTVGNGSCNATDANFQKSVIVGSPGTPFCESSWGASYLPITNVTLWDVPNFVVGIQATYSDGTQSPVHGRQTDRTPATISVDYIAGQTFKATQLFNFHNSRFIHHVRMVTSQGCILNSGEELREGLLWASQPVGSGVLYGFQGSTSERGDLQSLGFLFS